MSATWRTKVRYGYLAELIAEQGFKGLYYNRDGVRPERYDLRHAFDRQQYTPRSLETTANFYSSPNLRPTRLVPSKP